MLAAYKKTQNCVCDAPQMLMTGDTSFCVYELIYTPQGIQQSLIRSGSQTQLHFLADLNLIVISKMSFFLLSSVCWQSVMIFALRGGVK